MEIGSDLDGKTVELVAPESELEGVMADTYVMFEIIENAICVCVVPVSGPDVDVTHMGCK